MESDEFAIGRDAVWGEVGEGVQVGVGGLGMRSVGVREGTNLAVVAI